MHIAQITHIAHRQLSAIIRITTTKETRGNIVSKLLHFYPIFLGSELWYIQNVLSWLSKCDAGLSSQTLWNTVFLDALASHLYLLSDSFCMLVSLGQTSLYYSKHYQIGKQISKNTFREAPPNIASPLFGHCPNSDCTPPPALKRALWGTFFRADLSKFAKSPFWRYISAQSILASLNTLFNTSKCPF